MRRATWCREAFTRLLTVDGWAQIEAPHPYLLRMMRNLAFEKLRRAKIARFRATDPGRRLRRRRRKPRRVPGGLQS
ncbi:hypothetical protein ACRAWD_16710 [Caulobacter segnis]